MENKLNITNIKPNTFKESPMYMRYILSDSAEDFISHLKQ